MRPSLPLVVVLAGALVGAALSSSRPERSRPDLVRALPAVKRVLARELAAELPRSQALLAASHRLAGLAVRVQRARSAAEGVLQPAPRPGCAPPEWQAPSRVPGLDRALRALDQLG